MQCVLPTVLNLQNGDWYFNDTSILTKFEVTPTEQKEWLLFVHSSNKTSNFPVPSFSTSSSSSEFFGWIPIHFKPCLEFEEGCKIQQNSYATVTVTLLGNQGQQKLKAELAKNCPQLLNEINQRLQNKEKGLVLVLFASSLF